MKVYDIDTMEGAFHYFANTEDEDWVMKFRHRGWVELPHVSQQFSNNLHFTLTDSGKDIVWNYIKAMRDL